MKEVLKNSTVLGVLLVALSLASGCVAKKPVAAAPQTSKTEEMVSDHISKAADQIMDDLSLLASLTQQDAIVKEKVVAQPRPESRALHKPLAMIWNGPLEPAIQTIATAVGWTFEVTGHRPVQPIVVQIRSEKETAAAIIENCGWQAGNHVAVLVDEGREILKIVYLPGFGG